MTLISHRKLINIKFVLGSEAYYMMQKWTDNAKRSCAPMSPVCVCVFAIFQKKLVMAASAGKRTMKNAEMLPACENPRMDNNSVGEKKKKNPTLFEAFILKINFWKLLIIKTFSKCCALLHT